MDHDARLDESRPTLVTIGHVSFVLDVSMYSNKRTNRLLTLVWKSMTSEEARNSFFCL